ncbi:hypothetical protein P3L10_032538 [Capsicum annuum]
MSCCTSFFSGAMFKLTTGNVNVLAATAGEVLSTALALSLLSFRDSAVSSLGALDVCLGIEFDGELSAEELREYA